MVGVGDGEANAQRQEPKSQLCPAGHSPLQTRLPQVPLPSLHTHSPATGTHMPVWSPVIGSGIPQRVREHETLQGPPAVGVSVTVGVTETVAVGVSVGVAGASSQRQDPNSQACPGGQKPPQVGGSQVPPPSLQTHWSPSKTHVPRIPVSRFGVPHARPLHWWLQGPPAVGVGVTVGLAVGGPQTQVLKSQICPVGHEPLQLRNPQLPPLMLQTQSTPIKTHSPAPGSHVPLQRKPQDPPGVGVAAACALACLGACIIQTANRSMETQADTDSGRRIVWVLGFRVPPRRGVCQ